MNDMDKRAIKRIKESLKEWSGQRYTQHVLSEDLILLLKLVEKCTKKPCDK